MAQWINLKPVHWLQRFFTHPLFGWIGLNLAFVCWHAPAAYELALRSNFTFTLSRSTVMCLAITARISSRSTFSSSELPAAIRSCASSTMDRAPDDESGG